MVSLRPLAFLSVYRYSSTSTQRAAITLSTAFAASILVPSFGQETSRNFCSAPSSNSRTVLAASGSLDTDTPQGSDCIMTGYLDAASAAALDVELMSEPGFSLDQLMELAGLAVAEAVYQVVFTPERKAKTTKKPRILLVCGPGNNGGDGLVAARHLVMFGMECVVVYPKQSKKQHFINLVKQCEDVGITVLSEMPDDLVDDNVTEKIKSYTVIVDAIFGFSFHGEAREPFATILQQIQQAQKQQGILTVAVDVPSGWNVDEGDVAGTGFVPDVLVSLTTPKHCSKEFLGRHFVGGRFLPPALAEKYNVRMPAYPGVSQVVEVSSNSAKEGTVGWEEEYAAHLAEKEAKEFAAYSKAKPIDDESWEAGYAAHCAEKEAKDFAAYSKAKPTDDGSWEAGYAAHLAEKDAKEKE
jgi:NAD(P)H-hydrate epimerase